MRQSPQPYWFKRRRYGYGWVPVTWQGWTALSIFLGILVLGSTLLPLTSDGLLPWMVSMYLLVILVGLGALVTICLHFGPAPKWRWGKHPNDNDLEDW